MHARSLIILLVTATTSTLLPARAELAFFPLGDLPGGLTNSAAYGVSANGEVVVGTSASATGMTAFVWTESGGLTALPMLTGGTSATAYAASADGSLLVGSSDSASGQQACIWSNGQVTGLSDLAGGIFQSEARDVSDDGAVIVGYGTSASGREAFRWTAGVMTGLGDLAGGSYQSEALAVSPDGTRVTGYGTASSQSVITWNAIDGLQNYYSAATAYGISADGSQLAGYVNATFIIPNIITLNYRRASRWNNGTATVLGPESTGQSVDSVFNGMTPDAALAVGSFKNSSGPYYAVSHDAFNGIRNLKDVLTNGGIDMTGWELTAATAISTDGSVIVGYGINPDGQQEAWVIKGYSLGLTLRWIGNNAHWPANGSLTASDSLWMNIDCKDLGVAVTGLVVYSTDRGETWSTAPLTRGTPGADYDHFYQNLGSYPAGTTIRYSLAVEDAEGNQLWDNNQGHDYYAVVSPGVTGPVEWIGNDVNHGTTAHSVSNRSPATLPSLALTGIAADGAHLLARELSPNYPYTLESSTGLNAWSSELVIQPTGTNSALTVTNAGATAFYRLQTAATSSYVVITRETWPQDSGKAARVGYSIAGGTWQTSEMHLVGQAGNNDVWQLAVGPVPPGASVTYYIEVISAAAGGFSHFDNNDNSNYTIAVP